MTVNYLDTEILLIAQVLQKKSFSLQYFGLGDLTQQLSFVSLIEGQVKILLKRSLNRSMAHTRNRSQIWHASSKISSDLLLDVFDELRPSNLAAWGALLAWPFRRSDILLVSCLD